MKRIIIYSMMSAMVFFACRKSDNSKLPDLMRVPVPSVKVEATSDKFISPAAPASFKGKIVVDLVFKNDIPPQKMDLVVIKNGNKATVKTLKAGITSFPSTVDITGQQLIDAFAGPIADGDLFDVGVDITTQGGQTFQAFPAVGAPYGTGVANENGGVNVSVQFIKPCTFVASQYAGDFTVVADEWNDYKAGAVIPVKVVSATQISFVYAVDAGTAKPIIMTIDPATNAITVAKQVYGSYGTDVFSAETVPGSSSVNPCDKSLTLKLTHTTTGYSSPFTIKLIKK